METREEPDLTRFVKLAVVNAVSAER